MDPRELARAEEKIKLLQKENDLLKTTLEREKQKPAMNIDAMALEQLQKSVTEANRKLVAETQRADTAAKEKKDLEVKLANLAPGAWNATTIEKTKEALAEATRNLQAETAEKQALQARVKALTADAKAAELLRIQNQALTKQVADLKATTPAGAKPAGDGQQLADARAQVAALQSEKEILRLQTTALENRVKQLSGAPPATTAAAVAPEDTSRLKKLERERDDLQKKLDAANKELYSKKGKAAADRIAQLEAQVTALRTQIDVYEARRVPYSAEELALFQTPEPKLAAVEAKPGKRSVRELPPQAAKLAAEAHRYFDNKQFAQAEAAYSEALRLDDKSAPTLAQLAATQLRGNHLASAEINVKQALVLEPDYAYGLSVLGQLRILQEKYDEALEALSRAAKLDPQDSDTQAYLGIALSEKGLRGPAEAALRKAILLEPKSAIAHYNLAVVYATQQPPALELARWHYQKALAAGQPKNAQLEKMLQPKDGTP
jgi:cytochrome c-type biogenesis protein CcmH/NrfG